MQDHDEHTSVGDDVLALGQLSAESLGERVEPVLSAPVLPVDGSKVLVVDVDAVEVVVDDPLRQLGRECSLW